MSESLFRQQCDGWAQQALADHPIDRNDALAVLDGRGVELLPLVEAAGRVRQAHHGKRVTIHVLDNARNGACPEDCGYCGQSKDSNAPIQPYKIKPVDELVADARTAQERGAYRFCMALSGRGPSDRDVDHMAQAISRIKAMGMRTCLSAGLLDDDKARRLREAGLDRLNHNLNTAESNYESICSTHTYADRLRTLESARSAGLGLCSGLIVGMGESHEDLIDIAYALRQVGAESVPVNFLLPIDGNRVHDSVSGGHTLTPEFCLRVLCVMRLILPTVELRVAAGREQHFRSLQSLALWPANSLFMEGYLLTEGQAQDDTLRLILDAGFEPVIESTDAISHAVAEQLKQPASHTVLKTTVRKTPSNFVPVENLQSRL